MGTRIEVNARPLNEVDERSTDTVGRFYEPENGTLPHAVRAASVIE